MFKNKKYCLFLSGLVLFSCSESGTDPVKKIIEIDLPLDQQAVYATAVYAEINGTLTLNALRMSSVVFSEDHFSGDTTYLKAEVKEFIPQDFPGYGSNSGSLQLSISEKWISVENETNVSASFLYKSYADTTAVPTSSFLHDAVYPRILSEGQESEIFRPASDFSNAVYKKFRVGREINWDDAFGFGKGLYMETQSSFASNDTLYTVAIYDEQGLIISQYSLDIIIFDGQLPADTIRAHYISRRVNNFMNPLLARELSFYAELVKQRNLTPIY